MANNPTVVIGSLNDEELKKSIDKLVNHVDKQLNYMVSSTKVAVMSMQNSLKSLGDTKIDFGGAANGGATKRTKAQNEETAAIKESTQAYKDKKMALDQMASSQQVAIRSANPSGIRNADTLQTMNIQLDLLRERLREARQQYSSFVALAAHATTTGDKGLFQYATDGVHRYEQEVRSLIPQIRGLQDGIQQMGNVLAPQGHTIQNYVNSLQKANPELAQLNEQYKRGQSLLQEQTTSISSATNASSRYSEAIRRQAQAIRESQQWKEKGYVTINGVDIYNLENSTKSRISLEEQLVKLLNEEKTATSQVAQEQLKVAQNAAATNEQLEKARKLSNKGIGTTIGEKYNSIPTFTTQLESANALSKRLKELKEQYNSLSYGKRLSAEGQAIAQQIREITRQGQKLSNELNRPTKKEVFGLSEKTLDDISYKMRQLASYRSWLDANAQHNEIRRVNYEYDVLKKKMDEIMQKNSQMISSNTALGRSWNYMKNRLAFYFTVGASTQFVKNLIEVRSQYEMNERALGILVDSAERGTQIFRELSDMALVSPYTLIELSSAAKQLTAYDVAAKDVVDTTRRLADMASAVGVPVERLTYALGQIKAYGYLNSRDARMFANAGIPLVKELADHYTRLEGRLVSTADVYDRIKKKAIDYNDVMQVMNEMTDEGGKFYDFQAKMADTLKVQLANLTLAWNNMLNDLGNSQQGLLTSGIGALKELFLHWKDLDRILTNLAVTIGTAKAAQLLLNMSFGKGTFAAIKNISAIEGNTAAMYENALSKSNLSKAEARWLVSTNRSNVALRAAMVNMKLLTVEEAKAAASTTVLGVRMGWLGRVMRTNFFGLASVVRGAAVGMEMLGKAMLSIVTNPVFLTITAAMAVTDALLYYNQVAEKTAEMNKAIADNAKEASEAIGDYLKDSVNIGNRAKAAQGVLSVSEGQKAWESIREQIELSSDAASVFISKLLEEEDINKRVKDGFDVAESIREATNAMAGLNAEALKVSQDSWLWGAFGEGLAEDLEDYIEKVQQGRKNGANIGSEYFAAAEFNEAMDELTAFANDAEEIIRDRLGAGVNDAVQLKEAIERIKKEVIAANPQIKGEVKKWFDVEVDRMMAERFGGVYNELSSIQSQFIEHIKHDSGAALRRLSDDILDTSKELDDEVLSAISKAWGKLKDELPAESQDLISKLQKQMDENPLTLRVLLLQAGEQQIRDDIQKDYEEHFYDSNIGEKPTRPKDVGSLWGDYKGDFDKFAAAQKKHEKEMVEYNQKNAEWEAKRAEYVAKYGDFNKKNDETRAKWAKRVNDEIEAADAEEKAAKHARQALESELSLEERKTDARYLSAVQEEQAAKDRKSAAQEAWNYEKLYQEEKNKGNRGSKKDPLLDALKQEISLVEKLQSDYDKLSKSGASQADALDTIRGAYGKTIRLLNTQLQSYGLPQIDISKLITGKDPHKSLEHFKQTLDTLVSKGLLTLERSKEIEAVIEKFTLSAKTYDLDKITKGLNSELDRLKEEYELAVALDADPELGSIFADWMGFDMDNLPRTAQEYANQATNALNKALKDRDEDLELPNLLNITDDDLRELQGRVDTGGITQTYVDEITKGVKAVRDVFSKELTSAISNYGKLLDKYGDYVVKVRRIEEEAATERKDLVMRFGNEQQKSKGLKLHTEILEEEDPVAKQKLVDDLENLTNEVSKANPVALKINASIGNSKNEKLAQASFEEFQKSREWVIATGDLATLSRSALGMLIKEIEKYKKTAKNLTPKQIKAINNTLKQLKREVRKNNPFAILKNTIEDSKERMDGYQSDMKAIMKEIIEYEKKIGDRKPTEDEQKDLDALKKEWEELYEKMKAIGSNGWDGFMQGLSSAMEMAKQASSLFTDMFGAFGDEKVERDVNRVFSIIDKTMQGAMMGTAIAPGYGTIIGAGVGLISGLITTFADQWSGNKAITEMVQESELAVKKLTNAYKMLEDAAEQAFGASVLGAKEAIKANKELQLVELKRQLALEESRSGKNYDENKATELKGQIIDLENEIRKASKETLNDILGISSHGDFFEDMISEMIDAFKNGEDAMKVFEEKWSNMIDNMIMKTIVSQVLQNWIDSLEKGAEDIISKYTQAESNEIANQKDLMANILQQNDDDLTEWIYRNDKQAFRDILNQLSAEGMREWDSGLEKKIADIYKANMQSKLDDLNAQLDKASLDATGELIDYYGRAGEDFKANYLDVILDKIKENWNFGQDSENKLSQLQQGIQGITEDQAGALEAYWNANTQQQYVQSDLLREIRNLLAGGDADIQTGVQAQMLLQLQQSYQVQMSIENILQSVLNPSGRAFSVELLS